MHLETSNEAWLENVYELVGGGRRRMALDLNCMAHHELTFAEWITFEANRIVELGLLAPEQHRADYMRVQIEAALRKAAAHFRDGLGSEDAPRAIS
jgi:hypothetical protein